ncbi:UNVERIFIED_ORG: ATP-dependent Zn protease [Martelella mediterranea]
MTAWITYADTLIARMRVSPEFDGLHGASSGKHRRKRQYHDRCDESALDIPDDTEAPSIEPPDLPQRAVSLALRLARTWESENAFEDGVLAPRALTCLSGMRPGEISMIKRIMTTVMMPAGRLAASDPAFLKQAENGFLLLAPATDGDSISARHAVRDLEEEIRHALDLAYPTLVLMPDQIRVSPDLQAALPAPVRLASVDRDIMSAHLRHRYPDCIDGQADPALQLPDNIGDAPFAVISASLREATAAAALARLKSVARSDRKAGPTLEDISGHAPALAAARMMVDDLKRWQGGQIAWDTMSRSLLLYGPPGTGKSYVARAMGNSADIAFIQASVSLWQAQGHLGDLLAAMRTTFADARARAPCILFLDEIDSAGSRFDDDSHARSYRRQVVNGILEEIDIVLRCEGVILVGACNDPGAMDPALLRAGRFDLKIEMPRPDRDGILSMLRQKLEHDGLGATDLDALARRSAGMTAADIDAGVRQARTLARAANRALSLADLERVFPSPASQDPERDWRIAVHEAGHAIVTQALGMGTVQRVALVGGGGVSVIDRMPTQGRICDIESALTCLMAGRAAEMLILGNISSGAGGPVGSDLEQATALALRIDTNFGIGEHGPTWLGDIATVSLRDPDQRRRVRARLEQAEQHASEILAAHQEILTRMARNLVHERELTGGPLQNLLSDVVVQSKASAPHQHATRADEDDTKKGTDMPIQEKTSC